MKKTYFKIIIREIKESFGRFAAIFGIVALGVGFLAGLLATTPDMHLSLDEYYVENNMADIFIKATMGLTKGDIKEVLSLEEIDELMPAYVTDTLMETSNSEVLTTRIYGLPLIKEGGNSTNINRLKLLAGRMPQNKEECLVERSGSYLKEIELGSRLRISEENDNYEDISDTYKVTEYTVVGIVGNSFHFSMEREISSVGNGRIGSIIYVDVESYSLDVYTDFYLTATGTTGLDSFSDEYNTKVERIVDNLETLGKRQSQIRYKEIVDKANEELEKGKKEYEDAKLEAETELNNALKEIEDGKKELADALKEIKDGKKELAEAKITLKEETIDAQKKIDDAKLELADALIELEDGEKELKDAWVELQDGQKEYLDGFDEYLEAKKEIEDGQREFDNGEEEYFDGLEKLEDGKKKLKKGEKKLASAKSQLEDVEYELSQGQRELDNQKAQFEQLMSPYLSALGYSSVGELFDAIKNDPTGSVKDALTGVLLGTASYLEGEVYKLNSQILEVEAAISMIETQLEELNALPEPDEATIMALEAQLKELEGQLHEMKQGLKTLESNLLALPKDASILIGGWNAIKDGESQLVDAERKISRGWDEYSEGKQELKDAKKDIEKAEIELEDAKKELEENRKELEDGWKELDDGRIELEDAKKKLDDGYIEYYDGRKELDDAWIKYKDGLVELEDAKNTLVEEVDKANKKIKDAEKDLSKGQIDYNKGVVELSDGEKTYLKEKLDAEKKLADAAIELADAEDEIADLEIPKWYVLDRNSNMSFVSYRLNADKVAAISKVFPIFFYLVAALVALTTMTRMVEEERTQIGTFKALGYTKNVIMFKYTSYSGLSSLLGSIGGLLVGFKLLPIVLYNAYGVMYHLPDFIAEFNTKIAIISSGLAILSTIAATVYACNQALKEKPATLMLPRAPKAGKRILLERIHFIWSRMSFNHKATARNLFRYKKHFFMTVVGISGCTALLLTGFGLRDSIGDLANTQFIDIYKYDIKIELDGKDDNDSTLTKVLDDTSLVDRYMRVFTDKGLVRYQDEKMEATIFIPENPEDIDNFINIRDRKSGKKINFKEQSIIITEKMSEILGLVPGDILKLENSDGELKEFMVSAVAENYLGNYVYMIKEEYDKEFNLPIIYNSIVAETPIVDDIEKDNLISKFLSSEDVLNAEFITQTKSTFDNLVTSINYIVVVIIIASGALAFIVLYNLTNININERRKELATLKVLGYHNEEVSRYIFRETNILTIIGIMVGLFLGILLHGFIILTVEDPAFMFGRTIKILSYGLSALITIIFSLIVNIFMYRKLRNIKMVDSMKAND